MKPSNSSCDADLLIVDDNEPYVESLREELNRMGYKTLVAFTREEANEITDRNRIQAAIVDLNLVGSQDGQGVEVIRHLRRVNPEAKVMLISSIKSSLLKRLGDEIDADWTAGKPVSAHRLSDILNALDVSAGGSDKTERAS